MGSLSLAGAIGGAGKGMQSNVEHNRTMEAADLDRNHDMTLERMRSKNYETAARIRSEHETGMAKIESDQDLAAAGLASTQRTDAADLLYGRQGDLASIKSGRDIELQKLKNKGAIDTAEVRNKVDREQKFSFVEIGPPDENGMPTEKIVLVSYDSVDGKYHQQVGGKRMEYDFVSNLPPDEKALATRPQFKNAMHFAQAKGGVENLPDWYKELHVDVYENLQEAFATFKTDQDSKQSSGGALKEADRAEKTTAQKYMGNYFAGKAEGVGQAMGFTSSEPPESAPAKPRPLGPQ